MKSSSSIESTDMTVTKSNLSSTSSTSPKSGGPNKKGSKASVVEHKTKIAARLVEAVQMAPKVNRSADLVPLTHRYETMRKQFKRLIAVAKTHREITLQMSQSRVELAKEFSFVAMDTPIQYTVGKMQDLHQQTAEQVQLFGNSMEDKVIDYCSEWETIVTTQIDRDIKETNKLQEDLNHYERKVKMLRQTIHGLVEKEKVPPKSKEEKLERNEKKLDDAWKIYEGAASTLCHLLEQVTEYGWKDLFPLIKNYNKIEAERAFSDKAIVSKICALNEAFDEVPESA